MTDTTTTIEWTPGGLPDTIAEHWHWYDGKRDAQHIVCVFYGVGGWKYRLPGHRPSDGYPTPNEAKRAAEAALASGKDEE